MVDRGWCVSFSGALTRGNNRRGKHLARTLPDHGILVETDAPAIGLEGVMPDEVEPRHAARVAGTLAALRGCSPEDIARQTTGNAIRLFGPRLAGVLG
ncbi:MAG: TatD family hydrolase [Deltaproteobacteria bacterium]|nr:TatD family hydrolase [Deltaproteobacteria bacterium]